MPAFDAETFASAPYAGRFGWVTVVLERLDRALLERLLRDAWRSTVDPRKQLEASHAIQRYILAQAYYPNIATFSFLEVTRDYVKGFKYLGKLMFDYSEVWLDK